ncbi:MAG: hypothetical protein IPK52_21570 [Chloroflexi bacterium]|nr:hypothetical protein [Chloroflexota bacterium]
MGEMTITLPRPYPAQRTVKEQAARFNVLACGRRWGKTELVKTVLIEPALQGYPTGYFAPSYKFVLEVWNGLVRTLSPLIARRDFSQKRIELITNGVIEMWTMDDPDAGRSRKYKTAVIDEAGLIPNLIQIFQEAIRPTLMDYSGSAWFPGTPKGHNDFWRMYETAGDTPEWARWQRPTHDNPFIPTAELDAAKTDMTENRYRQEILAEFLEDGAGVFRYVRRAVYGQAPALADLAGRQIVIGVDLGKINDYTVFAALDLTTGQIVRIDRMQGDYTSQLARLRDLCAIVKPSTLIIETNTGQMFIEEARRMGLPVVGFTTTAVSKQPLIERLALAFEHQTIGIPDDAVLISELMAYESERLPGGSVRYSAPDGQHDDTVMAVALAWHAMRRGERTWGERSIYE